VNVGVMITNFFSSINSGSKICIQHHSNIFVPRIISISNISKCVRLILQNDVKNSTPEVCPLAATFHSSNYSFLFNVSTNDSVV